MTTSRKLFIGRVTLPPLVATSLYEMMRDSSLHWGFETTALTTPSLDSILGSECSVIPDAAVYRGIDSTLNSSNGVLLAAGGTFEVEDFAGGVVDPTQIYFWNQSGTQMSVIFKAR